MILTAHQPGYMPWIGLFHKIYLADTFCYFDIAQYQNKEFDNRNKIKTNTGGIWLTVPVESKNHFEKKLCEVKVVDNGWQRKHIKSIELAYKKSNFFDYYFDELSKILLKKHNYLVDLNIELIEYFLTVLGIEVKTVIASNYNFQGKKSDLVLDMCEKLGANDYIFGSQGINYADIDSFQSKEINVFFQNYEHPSYEQLHGEFEPYMSILDLIFNCGDRSREIMIGENIRSVHEIIKLGVNHAFK